MADAFDNKKPAWVFIYAIHPYCVGYPGVRGDLFFSSPEKFAELWGELVEGQTLLKVTVPADFDNWDYVPNDY